MQEAYCLLHSMSLLCWSVRGVPQTWDGVPPRPEMGTPWSWDGVPPRPETRYPLDLVPGTLQTWDWVPPRHGTWYPPPTSDLRWGIPPGVDWQTENSTFPHPSDAGGNNRSAEKLKICLIVFTFIHIFDHNFFTHIHSAIIPMRMDLNPSLRCSIEVNVRFVLCNH